MGQDARQRGYQQVIPEERHQLASAVLEEPQRFHDVQMADLFINCHDILSIGLALAWGLCNAKTVSQGQGHFWFFDSIFNSDAWLRARRPRQALPICEGDFAEMIGELRKVPLAISRESTWQDKWGEMAWQMAACHACNCLMGEIAPMKAGRWTSAERRLAEAIGTAVKRLLSHGRVGPFEPSAIEKELEGRRVNYQGEEVGTCHPLTKEQVLPALPPKEHGGSIALSQFLSASTNNFLKNPSKSVVPDVGQEIPKLQGKIHVGNNEIDGIAAELVERNVCKWIPLSQVLTFRGEKVLNGLFGVEKPARTATGKPILRLIMNLVPSNSVLKNYVGAVKHLPQITSWLNITLETDEQVKVWQSDMSNAFYLFRLPDGWETNLAFNVVRDGSLVGGEKGVDYALSCIVLPMGWTNSVSLMQEASENILLWGNLDRDAQISRGTPLPPWITGMIHTANNSGKAFWHVYLDNFAAGQIGGADCNFESGNKLHQLAEQAWAEANVVSSVKKQRIAESQAQELGAYINGELQTIGGSSERLIKLVQATLYILSRPHLSRKLTQVVAGRWIHVFQFRRPAMSLLEATWEFSSSKGFNRKLIRRVRRELYSCMCALPFLHTFLGARISDVITASDSSSHGGAVGIAKELTPEGEDYVASVGTFPRVKKIPVMVISLFNGIGGALRVYDMLGLTPVGIAIFDIHKPSNRVTAKRWPHAEVHGDVRELDKDLIQHWLRQYIPLSQVHLWAGFPCTDLSSVRFGRQGLEGPASGLFWEVVRIKRLLRKELPLHVALKFVGENVASMDKKECERITEALEVKPYYLNPVDSVPMQRPRLCWTSEEIEGCMTGLTFEEKEHWTEITADGLGLTFSSGSHLDMSGQDQNKNICYPPQ